MKKTTEVRNQLVTMLGQIATAQGYNNDFVPSKVYKKWDKKLIDDARPVAYPKTFVMVEKGEMQRRIGGDSNHVLSFIIIHIVRQLQKSDDSQAMIESAIADFERFFELNDDLGGFVQSADIVEFTTDGGILDPEGILVFRVRTERSRYGNP
jgi:hypothetical protein